MSEQKHLRPAPGLKVRRPDGAHLSETGETVVVNSYWQRKLDAGDVTEFKPVVQTAVDNEADTGRSKKNRE